MNFSDMIIELHQLSRQVGSVHPEEAMEIRILADKLARIGNKLYEKEVENERS